MATKDFVTFTPNSGNKNTTVNVTVNENEGAARETSLTISGNGVTKKVNISQEVGGTLITKFLVYFVSDIFISGDNDGNNPFEVILGIYDSSNTWREKKISIQPGENVGASALSFPIQFTASDNVKVLDPHAVKVRIRVSPYNSAYTGTYLGSIRIINKVIVSGESNIWSLLPSSLESYFTKSVQAQATSWTNAKADIAYQENLQVVGEPVYGTITTGDLGEWILNLRQKS